MNNLKAIISDQGIALVKTLLLDRDNIQNVLWDVRIGVSEQFREQLLTPLYEQVSENGKP